MRKKSAILFFFALMFSVCATAQIYQHNFGNTPITANPYTESPNLLDPDLSNSSWTNNIGNWLGSSGALNCTAPTTATANYTDFILTFDVASGKELEITSFNFWREKTSGFIAPSWSMLINGVTVGTGSVPTTGSAIGNTTVSPPVTGLTGTVTVIARFVNSTNSSGSITLDNFILNGTVSNLAPPCPLEITSFSPASGPENTLVTLTGTGFNNTTGVTFDGVTATFSPLSDTELVALVPAGVTVGNIVVTSTDCSKNVTGNFNLLIPECEGDIYISELYDANSGFPGAIELYNPSSNAVNLSSYTLYRYGDIGDLSPSYNMSLTGTIAAGDTFIVAVSINDGDCSGIPTDYPLTNGINGNDEFELLKNGVVIDNVHAPYNKGYSVIRKPNAIAPKEIYDPADWFIYETEFCSDLDSHTANGSSGTVPDITHPITQYVCENASTEFSVSVSDSETYTYQWKVLNSLGNWVNVTNDANYSGATTETLDIQNIPFSFNGNQYYCEITSSTCDLISNAAQLNITEAPVIDTAIASSAGCTSNTGTITITPVNSEFGLSYSIDGVNYTFTNTFTNLSNGNYTVTIKNLSECVSESATVTINANGNQPTDADVSVTQPGCGETTGTITITPQTGSGIEYSIDNGTTYQSSNVFAGYNPGNYTVLVRNDGGCVSNAVSAIIDDAPPTPTDAVVTYIHPGCGETTGTITVTAQTGSGIEYSIDNGTNYQTSNVFAGYNPGNYEVVVRNDDGCVSNIVIATINDAPNTPTDAVVTYIHPGCGETTGTITITPQTGSGIEYSIDNGVTYQSSNVFSGYDSGDYNVLVRNDDGCVSNVVIATINDVLPLPTNANVSYIHPGCGETTGTITIATQTGSGIEYSIDNGATYQTSNVFAGYNPGNYEVVVRNDDGCVSNIVIATINDAPNTPTDAVVTYVHPGCGEITGTITITPQTGSGIEYSIDNGTTYQTSNVFAGYNPGNYEVVVRNDGGCVSNAVSATIDDAPPTPTDAVVTYIHPGCGETTGTITVTAQTGSGIEYSIDNGVTYQSSNVFAGYAPGDYDVVVRNDAGCVSDAITATINDAPTIPTPQYQAPALGCNETTGTIEITAPTGNEYTYKIDNGTYQASTTFAGYAPGSYTISVQNTDGCISTATATINPAPAIPADADVSFTQPSCSNPFGSITVNSPTGTGLIYSINNGTSYQSNPSFTGLPAGNYAVLVKNAAGCVSANPQTVTINNAPPVPTAAGYISTNPTCATPTGSITITSPTGINLEYSIDNGNTYSTNLVYNNLNPGIYQIVVRNTVGGCISSTVNVTISPAPNVPDDAVVIPNQPGCNSATGSITIQSPIGADYSYSIDGTNYQPLTTFYGIAPGNYFAYVKNTAGCISAVPTPFTIDAPPTVPVPATVTITNPDCTTATGSLEVTAPLGADLTYTIDGVTYQSNPIFTNLVPGNYTIRVQNTDGCISLPVTRTIQPQPATPAVPTLVVTQTDCFRDTGRIVVTSPIGTGYTYSIDGGTNYQGTTTFTNLAPGDYVITVRNSAGCTQISDTITIDAPPAPAPDPGVITGNDAICEGETTQLTNTVIDGIWSSSNENIATVDADGLVTSLSAGTVTISYTVGTECTDAATITVRINPLPKPTLDDIYYICQDLETEEYNSIMLSSGLSAGNHSFIWKKGDTVLPFISGFILVDEPGEYSVEATNLTTGCTGMATTTVSVSSIAVANAEVATDFQYNQTITVNVTGGSGDYEFSLNDGSYQDENIFTNITEGLYTITINDKNGCNPLVLEVYALNYPRFFSPNGDGQHETWNIKGLSNQKEAIIYIFDRYGKVVSVVRPGQVGWDGTYNGERLPATDYWFTLLYQSSNGTNKEFKAHFSLLR